MAVQQTTKFCKDCGRKTIHERQGANHIFHLIMAVVTAGCWIPIWILMSFRLTSGWNCRKCMG